jgi:hypothetical protein
MEVDNMWTISYTFEVSQSLGREEAENVDDDI